MTTSTGSPTGSCWLTISIFPPGRTVVLMCSARCMTCDLLFTGYRRRTNKTAHASKAVRPRHPSIRAPWPPRYPHSNPLPWEGEGIFVVAAESQGRHPNCPNNQHPPSFTSFRIIHIIVQNADDPTRRTRHQNHHCHAHQQRHQRHATAAGDSPPVSGSSSTIGAGVGNGPGAP